MADTSRREPLDERIARLIREQRFGEISSAGTEIIWTACVTPGPVEVDGGSTLTVLDDFATIGGLQLFVDGALRLPEPGLWGLSLAINYEALSTVTWHARFAGGDEETGVGLLADTWPPESSWPTGGSIGKAVLAGLVACEAGPVEAQIGQALTAGGDGSPRGLDFAYLSAVLLGPGAVDLSGGSV